MRPLNHQRRARSVEPLEPRLVLSSGSPLVGDAQFAYYDSQAYGTTDPVFERNGPTYDATGAFLEAGTRRFADQIAYAPPLAWTGTGVTPSESRSVRILAAGWDHDNSTPLSVVRIEGDRVNLYRGDDLTLVGSISNEQLSQAAGENRVLRPQAAVVFNGLVVIASERLEDSGNGFRRVGMTFLTTQDYGQTLDSVAQVGGGADVPPIAGGVADGIQRGRTWAFMNAFPVNGIDEANAAWFPWADYLDRAGSPKGGQIGLFKATRDAVGEAWVVEPNRVVYERWEPNDPPGGAHAHTAAITTAGLVSHWGDVGYRNEIKLHALDLDAYTTAPVTTTTLFGGYDETANVYREAPQPVSAAPGMRPGEHLASGDLTREIVLQFSDVQNGSDRLGVDGLVDRPFSTSRGLTYEGALVLQLHWMQGVGYVSSSGLPNGFGHFSANGEDWVAFNHDEQADGRVYLYGDKLLGLADGDELHLAPLPAVEVVRPLALAPGGTNLIASSLQNRFAPDDGLSLREVEFSAGLWRYADGGTPLDVQPEAPPFPTNTPIYEAVSDSLTATSFGTWWLQEAGATADLSETYQLEHWVANLGDQSVQLLTRLQAPGLGGQPGPIRGHLAATTGRWVALDYRGEVPYDVSGRLAANLELTEPAPGSRFLVAWPFLGVADNLPYPLAPGASGTDESEAFGVFEPTERWTAAFVAAWPENASLNGRQSRVLLTLDGQGDRRVEITAEYGGKFRPDRVAVSVFAGDVRLARNVHDMQILRGEAIDIVVSGDGRSLRSTARAGSGQVTQHEAPYHRSLTITSVRWGGAGGRSAAIEPIVISVDPHAAASAAEQRDWMYGSLQHKAIAFARHAPGDYNGDGVMDAADYTVWQDQLGIAPATGDSADGNRDGQITMADYDLWAEAYGRVVAVGEANPSDHNGDGLINAADYTVWRDQVGTAPDAGNSADGNRDGRITEADYDLWRDAFGTVVPTLADVLGTPLSDPPSSTSSTSTESEVPAVSPLPESREQLAALAAPVTPTNPPRAAYQTPRRQTVRTAAESSRAEALLAATAGDATREAAFADLRDSTGIESPTLDPGDKAATSSLRSNEAIGQVGFPPRVLDSL